MNILLISLILLTCVIGVYYQTENFNAIRPFDEVVQYSSETIPKVHIKVFDADGKKVSMFNLSKTDEKGVEEYFNRPLKISHIEILENPYYMTHNYSIELRSENSFYHKIFYPNHHYDLKISKTQDLISRTMNFNPDLINIEKIRIIPKKGYVDSINNHVIVNKDSPFNKFLEKSLDNCAYTYDESRNKNKFVVKVDGEKPICRLGEPFKISKTEIDEYIKDNEICRRINKLTNDYFCPVNERKRSQYFRDNNCWKK